MYVSGLNLGQTMNAKGPRAEGRKEKLEEDQGERRFPDAHLRLTQCGSKVIRKSRDI